MIEGGSDPNSCAFQPYRKDSNIVPHWTNEPIDSTLNNYDLADFTLMQLLQTSLYHHRTTELLQDLLTTRIYHANYTAHII